MNSDRSRGGPRVLVVALSGIGNVLMATPLLRALRTAHSQAQIDALLAPRGTAEILIGHPSIHEILLSNPKPSFRQWLATVTHLQRRHYNAGIVTHPGQLITSASLLFFGTVKRRVGFTYTWGPFRKGRFLSVALEPRDPTRMPLSDRSAHDVVQNLRLLEPLGIHADIKNIRYEFSLRPEDQDRASSWLRDRNITDAPLVGIHPGSHTDLSYKRWPAERWIALGQRMIREWGVHVLVFGGPMEDRLVKTVAEPLGASASTVSVSLRVAAALIGRCGCVISNDSGLMHVAVSQEVPTFGLFGPTDERRTAPWGPFGHVIRAQGTQPSYDVRKLRRLQQETDPSLLALSVDTVWNTVRQEVR